MYVSISVVCAKDVALKEMGGGKRFDIESDKEVLKYMSFVYFCCVYAMWRLRLVWDSIVLFIDTCSWIFV